MHSWFLNKTYVRKWQYKMTSMFDQYEQASQRFKGTVGSTIRPEMVRTYNNLLHVHEFCLWCMWDCWTEIQLICDKFNGEINAEMLLSTQWGRTGGVEVHLFSSLFSVLGWSECFTVYIHFINLLVPELFFLILAHPVYKMWIIQEPNTLELWNKLHFEEKVMESIFIH